MEHRRLLLNTNKHFYAVWVIEHSCLRGCRVSSLKNFRSHLDMVLGILLEQGLDEKTSRCSSKLQSFCDSPRVAAKQVSPHVMNKNFLYAATTREFVCIEIYAKDSTSVSQFRHPIQSLIAMLVLKEWVCFSCMWPSCMCPFKSD